LTQNNESNGVLITSPSTLRVKLKKPFLNGNADHNDEEYIKYKMPEKIELVFFFILIFLQS
jgi:hypothetical protein